MSKKQKIILIALWIMAAILVCGAFYVTFINCGYADVCFLDVGQGDSCFIRTEEFSNALIDGGDEVNGKNVLIPYLKHKGIQEIDAVFISHMHTDHASGVIDLLNTEVSVKTVYINEYAKKSDLYPTLLKAAESNGSEIKTVKAGDIIYLDNTTFKVLAPDEGSEGLSENDSSTVIRFDCGENSVLFTGDIEKSVEKSLDSNNLADTDIIKVAHHGSSTSSTKSFIENNSPILAIISVGENNRYRHPSEKTLDTLSALKIPVMRTDKSGSIDIIMTESDIKSINETEKR